MMGHDLFLEEAANCVAVHVMFLGVDPPCSDVHHILGAGGFQSGILRRLLCLRVAVLQSRKVELRGKERTENILTRGCVELIARVRVVVSLSSKHP